MGKIIGIVGTRKRDVQKDYEAVLTAFVKIAEEEDSIVSGGCLRGGDRFAKIIATELHFPIKEHLPDMIQYDYLLAEVIRNARSAYARVCYDRNTLIAQDADVLIACVDWNRRVGGTEDTIKKFKALGKGEKLYEV